MEVFSMFAGIAPLLANDTKFQPGNCFKSLLFDFVSASHTVAIGAVLDSRKGRRNRFVASHQVLLQHHRRGAPFGAPNSIGFTSSGVA